MKPRKRKNDPQVVQDLFALYELLNTGGKGWIKGYFHKRQKDRMCYCLIGGANKVTNGGDNWRSIKAGERMNAIVSALGTVIPTRVKFSLYRERIIDFNDMPETTWADVEKAIFKAIQNERKYV